MSQISKLGVAIEIMFCVRGLNVVSANSASRGWPKKDNINGMSVRFGMKRHRTPKNCV
jgi:hypothetical protein